MKKILVLLMALLFASLLSACGGAKETTLSGAEKEAVLAFSEAKTDNLMAGMNANDYAAFSKDFDQDMLAAMSQEAFAKLKNDYDGKFGAYVSRKVNQVTQSGSGKFVAVVYDTVFEKDDAVSMRVVFRADDPHQVSGLWFNK
jgi:hypothetical protein